jgi:PAS domain S-box-containing protein
MEVRAERRKAHRQKYAMQAMPDGVIIFDPRWRIAEANSAIYTLLGWSENVIGLSITEAFQQTKAVFFHYVFDTKELISELERRARKGVISEFKMIGADAKEYALRTTYTPIQDEIGDIFAYVIVCHDVTEQVEARQRIEAEVVERTRELAQQNKALQVAKTAQETEQARLELLLERLPSGVLLVSAQDNTVITINHHAIQLLRHMNAIPLHTEQAGIIGQDAKRLLEPIRTYDASGKFLTYEQRPLHLALREGKANEAELHMQGSNDEMLYVFASAAPLRASDGTISSAVLVNSDITRIKKLEQARDDFFTTMAHELKTPLANVRAQITSLLEKDVQWSPEEQDAALQTADEQLKRLISAVHRTLEVTRIEAGGLQLRLEAVFLPELFEDLEERLAALIASSQRQLRIVYPKTLPAVQADYELILSVLTNLLSNAFRYAPEGDTVLVEAKLVFAPEENVPVSVTVCVSDNGPGLTEPQQKFLFQRFSTLSMTNRDKGSATNTGLGLYISRGIVEAHGSKLTLVSSPGQGASFSFTLSTVSTIISK